MLHQTHVSCTIQLKENGLESDGCETNLDQTSLELMKDNRQASRLRISLFGWLVRIVAGS